MSMHRVKGPGEGADVIQLTDSNFDSTVMNSEDLWLVEFYAPWCVVMLLSSALVFSNF